MINNIEKYDKPFIKLIASPYNKYVYEVNSNKIYRVDDDVYSVLSDPQNTNEVVKEKINKLKKQGNLLNYHPKRIIHQATNSLQYHLSSGIRSITLQLTQQCNFRCAYCIYSEYTSENQRAHSSKEMSRETAFKAVDFLFSNSRDIGNVNIGFYGGEPLLKFELIKDIINYIESEYYGKSVSYSITTNGSLLTKDIIEYFINHNIYPMISLDGPQDIHDKYRHFAHNGKGTYDIVYSKIMYIKENYPEFFRRIKFSAVVDPQNDLESVNNFFMKYRESNGVYPNISLLSDSYTSEKRYFSNEYIYTENNERIKSLLSCLGYTQERYIAPIAIDFINGISRFEKNLNGNNSFNIQTAPAGPCIPGALRLFIDVDGNFYPCEHVSEKSIVMNIGNLQDGFDVAKVDALLNVAKLTEHSCKNCWAYHHCYQCAKFCDNIDSLNPEMRRKECVAVRNTFEKKLKYFIMLNEIMEMKNERNNEKELYCLSI